MKRCNVSPKCHGACVPCGTSGADPNSGDRPICLHRRITRVSALMGKLMLLMDRREWVRRRVIRALASESGLFSKLVAMHVDAMSAREFGLNGMGTLLWDLLTANSGPRSEVRVNGP